MAVRLSRLLRAATHTKAPADQPFFDSVVRRVGAKDKHPVSIWKLLQTGKEAARNPRHLLLSAQFLHSELPVRIAKTLLDYGQLPFIVGCNPHFRKVFDIYLETFKTLHAYPALHTVEDEQRFTRLLEKLMESQASLVGLLADGAQESMAVTSSDVINTFLDRTFRARIGIRLLVEHQVTMHRASPDHVGAIATRLLPGDLVRRCAKLVRLTAENSVFRRCPDIAIVGDVNTPFSYVPFHFEYIVTELLKNAVKATLKHNNNRMALPKIVVTVYANDADLYLRVADHGGGIPPALGDRIWAWSAAKSDAPGGYGGHGGGRDGQEDGHDGRQDGGHDGGAAAFNLDAMAMEARDGGLAGYGVGLPMSRAYAEYFGGSLDLMSMARHGTDAYLRLNQLTAHVDAAEEAGGRRPWPVHLR